MGTRVCGGFISAWGSALCVFAQRCCVRQAYAGRLAHVLRLRTESKATIEGLLRQSALTLP